MPPLKIDFKKFRKGTIEDEDSESKQVDGVMFASTDHGDAFCFDVKKDRKEFEVYLYNHESNVFEPYTSDFVSCIKRFSAKKQVYNNSMNRHD